VHAFYTNIHIASSFEETAKLWKSRFGDCYISCGCSSTQMVLSPSSKLKFWKRPSDSRKHNDIRPPPPATHPTEHNSIIAINPKKAVAESRRHRVASLARTSDDGHPQAFIGDYQNADAQGFSTLGLSGWDIDCVRQPFVVDSDQDRGDCCIVSYTGQGCSPQNTHMDPMSGCTYIVLNYFSPVCHRTRAHRNSESIGTRNPLGEFTKAIAVF
jgi:hypothetical protein